VLTGQHLVKARSKNKGPANKLQEHNPEPQECKYYSKPPAAQLAKFGAGVLCSNLSSQSLKYFITLKEYL
jgi:hypothetical protein